MTRYSLLLAGLAASLACAAPAAAQGTDLARGTFAHVAVTDSSVVASSPFLPAARLTIADAQGIRTVAGPDLATDNTDLDPDLLAAGDRVAFALPEGGANSVFGPAAGPFTSEDCVNGTHNVVTIDAIAPDALAGMSCDDPDRHVVALDAGGRLDLPTDTRYVPALRGDLVAYGTDTNLVVADRVTGAQRFAISAPGLEPWNPDFVAYDMQPDGSGVLSSRRSTRTPYAVSRVDAGGAVHALGTSTIPATGDGGRVSLVDGRGTLRVVDADGSAATVGGRVTDATLRDGTLAWIQGGCTQDVLRSAPTAALPAGAAGKALSCLVAMPRHGATLRRGSGGRVLVPIACSNGCTGVQVSVTDTATDEVPVIVKPFSLRRGGRRTLALRIGRTYTGSDLRFDVTGHHVRSFHHTYRIG
jgi:hypothetical protein